MDSLGARHLTARLQAGVRVGTEIELDCDDPASGLRAGDRGVVSAITLDGVVVEWERGFSRSIDPTATPYHALETRRFSSETLPPGRNRSTA
jgi:hypothetical protein